MSYVFGFGLVRARDLFHGETLTPKNAPALCIRIGQDLVEFLPKHSTGAESLMVARLISTSVERSIVVDHLPTGIVAFVRGDPKVASTIDHTMDSLRDFRQIWSLAKQASAAHDLLDRVRSCVECVFARMSLYPQIYNVLADVQKQVQISVRS